MPTQFSSIRSRLSLEGLAVLLTLAWGAAQATCTTAIVNLPDDRPDTRYEVVATATPAGSEVRDKATNLIWARCVVGMDWDGTSACVANPSASTSFRWVDALAATPPAGWRIPNVSELASLASKACSSGPAINVTFFPNTPAEVHWSGTEVYGDASSAWIVNFANGQVNRSPVTSYGRLRYVKDGP